MIPRKDFDWAWDRPARARDPAVVVRKCLRFMKYITELSTGFVNFAYECLGKNKDGQGFCLAD